MIKSRLLHPSALPRARRRAGQIVAVVALLASAAGGQTTKPTLAVAIGFDGIFKPDNWTPVYIALTDAERRAGTLELRVAHGRLGHDVVARVAANPAPATFTLFAPLGSLDRAQVQFRDADGRLLARRDLSDAVQGTAAAFGGFAVGVSGDAASARRVAGELIRDTGEYASAGVVEPRLLPERAIGYRAVDALVLAGLDTDAMDDRVEQAIVDWTRAGGIVIAWPGAQRPTRGDSPLAALLPADQGALAVVRAGDQDLVVRALARRDDPTTADHSSGVATTFRRRVGLGQLVFTNVDPTLLPASSPTERLARWRRLTEGEVSLLPDDRRRGVFDPLVAQSVAEQTIGATPPAGDWRPLLWAALAAGLLMGPGEIALLVVAGRHPRTPFTLGGLGLAVVAGGALFVVHVPPASTASATILVEAGDGIAEQAQSIAGPADPDGTSWLGGDASDPSRQPAGAATLAQREDRFDARSIWLASGASRPLTRSITFASTLDSAATQPTVGATIARPRDVATPDGKTIVADDPATARVETGIERLAADPQWAAIFLDRTLAARLVRLQETEGATITATRASVAGDVRIELRVER